MSLSLLRALLFLSARHITTKAEMMVKKESKLQD